MTDNTHSGISQETLDVIVAEEVSSKVTYQAHYQHPQWPGGASRVTIGIGYDCGYPRTPHGSRFRRPLAAEGSARCQTTLGGNCCANKLRRAPSSSSISPGLALGDVTA
jgi:hypothetical protein